jgi:hypothetical protein
MSSPTGAYNSSAVILASQVFSTGTSPVAAIGFPELHLDPSPAAPFPVTVLYGAGAFNMLTQLLPPSGVTLGWPIPTGVGPISVLLQGVALSPNPQNPFFTVSHGHEIQIQ